MSVVATNGWSKEYDEFDEEYEHEYGYVKGDDVILSCLWYFVCRGDVILSCL